MSFKVNLFLNFIREVVKEIHEKNFVCPLEGVPKDLLLLYSVLNYYRHVIGVQTFKRSFEAAIAFYTG